MAPTNDYSHGALSRRGDKEPARCLAYIGTPFRTSLHEGLSDKITFHQTSEPRFHSQSDLAMTVFLEDAKAIGHSPPQLLIFVPNSDWDAMFSDIHSPHTTFDISLFFVTYVIRSSRVFTLFFIDLPVLTCINSTVARFPFLRHRLVLP